MGVSTHDPKKNTSHKVWQEKFETNPSPLLPPVQWSLRAQIIDSHACCSGLRSPEDEPERDTFLSGGVTMSIDRGLGHKQLTQLQVQVLIFFFFCQANACSLSILEEINRIPGTTQRRSLRPRLIDQLNRPENEKKGARKRTNLKSPPCSHLLRLRSC